MVQLLPAGAVEVAVMAGVTIMEATGRTGVTFTGFRRHQTLGAVRKALILNGGKCILAEQACEGAGNKDQKLFHASPRFLMAVVRLTARRL